MSPVGARRDGKVPGFLLTTALCLALLQASVAQAGLIHRGRDFAALFTGRPLSVATPPAESYHRQDWPHWIDADHDCQDTRAEILIRDTRGPLKFKRNKACNVSWGLWLCPYTGKEIRKASELDIDHLVPLAHAQKSGGATWSREKKRQFANDPLNLLAVEAGVNRAKGDQAPDRWRPPRQGFWPEYARRWREVKKKYGLTISAAEEAALLEMAGATPPAAGADQATARER